MALTCSPPLNLLDLATIPHRFLHDFFVVTTQGTNVLGEGTLESWVVGFSVSPLPKTPGIQVVMYMHTVDLKITFHTF